MVTKCSAIGCLTNYKGHNTGAVFGLPKEEDLHRNVSKVKNIFICEKNFDDRFFNKNGKSTRLIISSRHFLRFCRVDQLQQYETLDNISNFFGRG